GPIPRRSPPRRRKKSHGRRTPACRRSSCSPHAEDIYTLPIALLLSRLLASVPAEPSGSARGDSTDVSLAPMAAQCSRQYAMGGARVGATRARNTAGFHCDTTQRGGLAPRGLGARQP